MASIIGEGLGAARLDTVEIAVYYGCRGRRASYLTEFVPVLRFNVGLAKNAPQRADGNIVFLWHDRGVDHRARSPNELYVTPSLARLHEACSLQPAFDLAKGLWLKPPQPRPQSCVPSVAAWLGAARSEVRAPPSGSREPLLPSLPGSQCPFQGTVRRTNCPRATS